MMTERRNPTHVLMITVPLDIRQRDWPQEWDIQGAMAEAIKTVLPIISLGRLGLLCDDVSVELKPSGNRP